MSNVACSLHKVTTMFFLFVCTYSVTPEKSNYCRLYEDWIFERSFMIHQILQQRIRVFIYSLVGLICWLWSTTSHTLIDLSCSPVVNSSACMGERTGREEDPTTSAHKHVELFKQQCMHTSGGLRQNQMTILSLSKVTPKTSKTNDKIQSICILRVPLHSVYSKLNLRASDKL